MGYGRALTKLQTLNHNLRAGTFISGEAPVEEVQVGVGFLALEAAFEVQARAEGARDRRPFHIQRPSDLQVRFPVQIGGPDEADLIRQRRVKAQQIRRKELIVLDLQYMPHLHVLPLDRHCLACMVSRGGSHMTSLRVPEGIAIGMLAYPCIAEVLSFSLPRFADNLCFHIS